MFEPMERWPESYFMKIVGSPEQACQQHIRRCYAELDRLTLQLEAVKRLAKAQYKDTIIKFDCDQDALEFEHAFNACLALGIDPKEL